MALRLWREGGGEGERNEERDGERESDRWRERVMEIERWGERARSREKWGEDGGGDCCPIDMGLFSANHSPIIRALWEGGVGRVGAGAAVPLICKFNKQW